MPSFDVAIRCSSIYRIDQETANTLRIYHGDAILDTNDYNGLKIALLESRDYVPPSSDVTHDKERSLDQQLL